MVPDALFDYGIAHLKLVEVSVSEAQDFTPP